MKTIRKIDYKLSRESFKLFVISFETGFKNKILKLFKENQIESK
ncbi:hypothetical protein LEP1GSC008_1381 [Leptospira kirschneri serovar Bulgarica str. Nikolaevo]|uniref:Uncharacterized protein n=1 Tax=Leptospira kirschneri serovar Bulgarica str. Nikolaevo TaxID=1240687 RepID=M6FTQ8_9LEPT|nr:hypothetical protein LEP1GSC008_1381 [Leptospira kirschneri serovar Bulgarica str. Nikolaevo]